MYLTNIYLKNCGPIEDLRIDLPISNDGGAPPTLILLGENGSGKTTLLAAIADALHEFAASAFDDILPTVGLGRSYFKLVGPTNRTINRDMSLSVLKFQEGNKKYYCIEKTGTVTINEAKELTQDADFGVPGAWNDTQNLKTSTQDQQGFRDIFNRGCHCFFPANRHEIPHWVNPRTNPESEGFNFQQRFDSQLGKPLLVDQATPKTRQWLLDVVLDHQIQSAGTKNPVWEIANEILRKILCNPKARFGIGRRGSLERLAIGEDDGTGKWTRTLMHSLNHLSAGQAVLLNMFLTILRYAEGADLTKSSEAYGIVLVDEIDLHLHIQLQRSVLPALIKLFPKIQFIFSTHAPFVPMAISSGLAEDKSKLIMLPKGDGISAEAFSEFQAAFDAFRETRKFESYVLDLQRTSTLPIVFVEGETDEKYIRKALSVLDRADLLSKYEIKFIGAPDPSGARFSGKSALNSTLEFFKANPTYLKNKTLLLYDCDANKPSEKIGNLAVQCIPKNMKNQLVTVGIENLLPTPLFEARFYSQIERTNEKGEKQIIQKFEKMNLCNYLCNERVADTTKDKTDFEEFSVICKYMDDLLKDEGK